jgi:hypothetical protein
VTTNKIVLQRRNRNRQDAVVAEVVEAFLQKDADACDVFQDV